MADEEKLRAEYDELKKNLLHHRFLYDLGQPEIEDYEYDQLMLRLKEIEKIHPDWITSDSPTQIVEVKSSENKIDHDAPMLSIDDVFSTKDVTGFVDKITKKFPDAEFLVEEKVDGVSAAMRYRNGRLIRVLSRGDGERGKDITANAFMMIENLIVNLDGAPPYVELRGEIFITRQNFERLNAEQLANDKEPFANPRNYTAGVMNSKNKQMSKHLSFVVHDMMKVEYAEGAQPFATASEFYRFLERNGVCVIHDYKVCRTSEEVLKAIDEIGAARPELDWALDGAVVKLNSFAQRSELGTTAKAPRWSIAYKFPPEIKQTVVREIELNVGRTGRITPVAIFDPIILAGTTVSRATLHNKDYIKNLDVRIGSTIEVFKSGEIIPKVDGVLSNPEGTAPYEFVEECPSCGSKLDMDDWRCINPNCPAQVEAHIIYFAGKNALDIEGLGKANVHTLIENGLVANIADLYTLEREQLIGIGFGPKETENLLEAIERSKAAPPEKILTGLGIEEVSSTTAQELIAQFGSIENIIKMPLDVLNKKLSKVSTSAVRVVAKNIREFFDVEENRSRVADTDPIKLLCEVPKVGKKTAEELLAKVPELERLANAPLDILDEWVGKAKKRESLVVARNVRAFFDLERNQALMERLRAMGLNIGDANVEVKAGGGTIVFTGKLNITRAEAGAMAEAAGFIVKNSITTGTTYLVVGEKSGSKIKKAEALGITILNEEQFYELIKNTPTS